MGLRHPPSVPHGFADNPKPSTACEVCGPALTALRIDVDVLMRLAMVLASVAARVHGSAFKAALLTEYERLSVDLEAAPGSDQALVKGLLSEIVGELD